MKKIFIFLLLASFSYFGVAQDKKAGKAKKETKQVKRSEAGSVVGGASSSASGTTVIREEFFQI